MSELLAREAAKRGGAARAWYEDDSSGSDEEPEAPAVPKEEGAAVFAGLQLVVTCHRVVAC